MPLPKSAFRASWPELAVEIWVNILTYLPVPDKNSIRLLSKHLRDLVDLPVVWRDVCIKIDILKRDPKCYAHHKGYQELCRKRQYKKILLLLDLPTQGEYTWYANSWAMNSFHLLESLQNTFQHLNEITVRGQYSYTKTFGDNVSVLEHSGDFEILDKDVEAEFWMQLSQLFNKLGTIQKLTIDLLLIDIRREDWPQRGRFGYTEPEAIHAIMMGLKTLLIEMNSLTHFSLHLPPVEEFSSEAQRLFLPTYEDKCEPLRLEHLDVRHTISGPPNEQQIAMLPHLKSYSASPLCSLDTVYEDNMEIQDYGKLSNLKELNIKCTLVGLGLRNIQGKYSAPVLPPDLSTLHMSCFDGYSKIDGDLRDLVSPCHRNPLAFNRNLRTLNIDIITPIKMVFNIHSLKTIIRKVPYVQVLHIRYVAGSDLSSDYEVQEMGGYRYFYQQFRKISWKELFNLRQYSENITELHLSYVSNMQIIDRTIKLGPLSEMIAKGVLKSESDVNVTINDCSGGVGELTVTPKDKTNESLPFKITVDCNVVSVYRKPIVTRYKARPALRPKIQTH
ncbi:unnamed protein product [Owenia fusiformis]|uniref:Uncharacterized protein n=1 Tax=Owenia fusiformis TaxID=6347 RepID=A0A8J1U7B1_OWEFU|nr:unnamed protein product [Owenia fusiformis]